jgi:hypothetical protein
MELVEGFLLPLAAGALTELPRQLALAMMPVQVYGWEAAKGSRLHLRNRVVKEYFAAG